MKLPLPTTLRNRRGNTTRDARILNGMVDKRGRIVKRPSLNQAFEPAEVGAGRGLFVKTTPSPTGGVSEEVVVVSDDVLTLNPIPIVWELGFSTQPTNAVRLNTAFTVVVRALDVFDRVVTGFTANVTVALSANPTGATLGGTLTVAAVAGVATFNNLTLDRSGENFRLRATASGARSTFSNTFDLATRMAFTTQPVGAAPDATMADVVVKAQDLSGNTDAAYTGDVTVEIYTETVDGQLNGTRTVAAIAGVATFNTLSIDEEGTYTLVATAGVDADEDCYTPSARVSDSFEIVDANYTLTSADINGAGWGFYTPSLLGSISPTNFDGGNIFTLLTDTGNEPFPHVTQFSVEGTHSQNSFTSITANGITLLSADATFSQGTRALWEWSGVDMFTASGTIPVKIV